jgi:hypothetical protein
VNPWEPSKNGPVVPVDPPQLLVGRTAADWSIRSAGYFGASLLVLVAITFLPAVPMPLTSLYILGCLILVGVCLAQALRATFGAYSATKAELRAGYTTLSVPDRPYVWLLNRKTGSVIRRPDTSRRPPWF